MRFCFLCLLPFIKVFTLKNPSFCQVALNQLKHRSETLDSRACLCDTDIEIKDLCIFFTNYFSPLTVMVFTPAVHIHFWPCE